MKKSSKAIFFILFLFSSAASAQTYSVRVAHNTNLRASYSLDARIVDVATAGATLSVTGSHGRWLRIDRNGREVWMADWVTMTRVEGGQIPSDVDNCCFVDRQCATDHEWTAGYWAYQNNQCGATVPPVSPVTSVPASTSASDASDVDNCCFLGWNCQTDHQWLQGFWNYQVGQCEHQGVIMEGSEGFKTTMDAALKLLRARSPHWYAYTLDGLSKIREVAGDKIRVSSRSGDNRWGTNTGVLIRRDISALAALLAHEACHVHRRRSGQFPTGGVVGETACVQLEIQVLDVVGPNPSRRDWLLYVLENIHDPAVQWWH